MSLFKDHQGIVKKIRKRISFVMNNSITVRLVALSGNVNRESRVRVRRVLAQF